MKSEVRTFTYFHVAVLVHMKHTITNQSNSDSEVGCKIPVDLYARKSGTHRNGMFSLLTYNLVFCTYLYLSDNHLIEMFLHLH